VSAGYAVQQWRPGEKKRDKDRGWLPAAAATTAMVVEDGFTLAASSKCSGTRDAPCFRLSGQEPREPAHQPIGVGWGFVGTEP